MDFITSLTSQVMHKAMDGLAGRHKAIASNLANVETPNYKRRDVLFENALTQAMQGAQGQNARRTASNDQALGMRTIHPSHLALNAELSGIDNVQPQMIEQDAEFRPDGNGVDVENEMVQLAKNTQRYVALTNLEGRMRHSLRSIITGGS